jgi:hypothetical protein
MAEMIQRWCCAAAHVALLDEYRDVRHSVSAPASGSDLAPFVDWETTSSLRRRLAAQGFTIAEAMDTAQRSMLGWPLARELIQRTGSLKLAHGFVAGAGADGLAPDARVSQFVDTVVEQGHAIRAAGGEIAILPLVPLALARANERTYIEVFSAIARELGGPLILHRLGPLFDPRLERDFPGESFRRVLADHVEHYRAVKYSMLDEAGEESLRRELLPRQQFVLTGDDWNFPRLIAGGSTRPAPVTGRTTFGARTIALGDFSHALLGILSVIGAPFVRALPALEADDAREWLAAMEPCAALGRTLFERPVGDYKAGVARIAFWNGWQRNPLLFNHQERSRESAHWERLYALAKSAGVLEEPSRAEALMRAGGW